MAVKSSVRSHFFIMVTLLFTLPSLCLISKASPPQMLSGHVKSATESIDTEYQVDSPGTGVPPKGAGIKESINAAKETSLVQGWLLYEVEKGIRTLSMDDIQYILNMGSRVFAYALAEKLRYKYDEGDPHVDVIDTHKETLIRKLNETFVKMQKPLPTEATSDTSEVTPKEDSAEPEQTENHRSSNEHKDKSKPSNVLAMYEVEKGLYELTLDDIDMLLQHDTGHLVLAVIRTLGFDMSESEVHVRYLIEMGGSSLREKLKQIKLMQDSKSQLSEETSKKLVGTNNKVGVEEKGTVSSTSSRRQPTSHAEGVPSDGTGGKDVRNDSEENNIVNSKIVTHDNEDNIVKQESELTYEEADDLDYIMNDDDFQEFLDQNYHSFYKELHEQQYYSHKTVLKVIDIYNNNFWLKGNEFFATGNEQQQTGDGKNPGRTNGGQAPVQVNEVEEANSDDEIGSNGRDDETDNGSIFGAWHFLVIFILIAAAVVFGYLFSLNRKKIRERVSSFVSDAHKRRRRARNYKPIAGDIH